MRKIKIIKEQVEKEETDKIICDNCNKEFKSPECDACGWGTEFHLSDSRCYDCGGKSYDFCNMECLKKWVSKKTNPSLEKKR